MVKRILLLITGIILIQYGGFLLFSFNNDEMLETISYLSTRTINGQTFYIYNFNQYVNDLEFNRFIEWGQNFIKQNITDLVKFDNLLNSLKSVYNVLVFPINLMLETTFSLTAVFSMQISAILGIKTNDNWWFGSLLNWLAYSFNIPYATF